MGFSVAQAKKALAATADGEDVQAALESLLSGGGGDDVSSTQQPAAQARPTPPQPPTAAAPPPPPPHPHVRGPPKGQKEREKERKERESQRTRREDTGSGPTTTTTSTTTTDIQDQADKLLLQASEIGLSVLSRASAFWKEGKEKVVKVMMEERGGGGEERGRDGRSQGGGRLGGWGGGGGGGAMMDGRPKWMKEAVSDGDDEFGEERGGGGGGGGFKDTVSPGVDVGEVSYATVVKPTVGSEIDLFSSDPIPPAAATTATHSSISVVSQKRPPPSQRPSQRPSQHPSRPPRPLPTTTPTTLSLASTHKNNGTSQFKLGQYGPASESYTSALALLPPGHLLLVPLYTNRSLARLRCGEYVGAGEDAGEALKIIICAAPDSDANGHANAIWNPDTEVPGFVQAGKEKANEGGWLDPRGVGVDVVDGYVKALRRRAEAWEGREKWVEAGRDWEVLAGGGSWIGEGVRKEAVRGAGRCRKMVAPMGQEGAGGSSSSSSSSSSAPNPSKPKPTPKPIPRPTPPSSTPSKALLAHQATTLQAEADDTLKHQLKDSVDGRISAWKNGKETNIRALLASLDMVLWDEMLLIKGGGGGGGSGGGLKVSGLGELVTDGQVKKGYMRAIAKVHPDKVKSFCILIDVG